jgi:hypothetical protein
MESRATHLPLLTAVMCKTTGPVIEFGCGDNSTPVLHEICDVMHRQLVTVENNPAWIKRVIHMQSDNHIFVRVKNWDDIYKQVWPAWDVVFIDHAPGERRIIDILKLKDVANHIVVHDTEEPAYNYEPVLQQFKYRYDCRLLKPWTTVVSNKKEF